MSEDRSIHQDSRASSSLTDFNSGIFILDNSHNSPNYYSKNIANCQKINNVLMYSNNVLIR